MSIAHPLWWSLILLSVGITIGFSYPSFWFLPAAIIVLITATTGAILRKNNGWLLLAFWFTLGAAQSSMESLFPLPSMPVWEVVHDKAETQRNLLEKRLQESGLQDESLSLGAALLLGKRDGISRELRQAYSESGAAHLLALSGLHLGILYGLLHFLIIRRIRFSQWKWFALPPLLLLLWGYVILTGMPLSLVRAAVMCTCHGHIACESLFPAEHQFPTLLLCRLLHPGHLFQFKYETEFHQPDSAVGKGLGSSMDGHSSIGRILFSHHPLAFHSYKPDSHSHHDYHRIPVSSHSARAISLFGKLPERTHLPAEQGCDTWCQHTGSKHWRITTQGMADSPCVRTVSDGHHQDERTQTGLAD